MKFSLLISIVAAVFVVWPGGVCAGEIISVDAAGGGDFTSIQAAIDNAANGDEIVVAPGTYDEAINFYGKAVRLRSSGGAAVTTIDGTGHYHVVQCVSYEGRDTLLEGFTITGGNADGSTHPDASGGGMLNIDSSPTVTGCIFTANAAIGYAGGMYNQGGSPIVTNCTFFNNTASFGGGMYNLWGSPIAAGCTFNENSANARGGGMYNSYSSPAVTTCIFSGNSATTNEGGGMYNDNSNPTLKHCLFSGNSAHSGGGMSNVYSTSAVINCKFTGNSAENSAGGIHNHSGSSSFINCIFIDNSTGGFGGAMMNISSSSPILINCTLTRNSGPYGSGIVNWSSTPSLKNCIVWGNFVQFGYAQIHNEIGSTTTVTYSNIQGGYSGTGNKNVDPLFVDAAGGNARLSAGSLCINAGSNAAVPAGVHTDLDGYFRVVNGVVDMGAYEFYTGVSLDIHNVTKDLYYATIQAAINGAAYGDQIEVPPGTYSLPINFLGKAVRLYSSDGPEVTIIDATGRNSSVVLCESGEGPDTILVGFTLTGGSRGMTNINSSPTVTNCIITHNSTGEHGGGMYNYAAHPTVTSCTFSHNTAGLHGGGMTNAYSSPTVVNCVFSQNTAGAGGGGMANDFGSSPTATNCSFANNTASDHDGGGGIYNYTSSPTVTNCIVWGNWPNQLINDASNPVVSYSSIQGGFSGTGNIDADPQFVDAAGGDLRLIWFSACLDAGDNAAVPQGVTTDLAGQSRITDGKGAGMAVVDMGAYESPQNESLGLSLQVTLSPAEAVAAGAGWRLAGQEGWRASGETLSDLSPGSYKVEFSELDEWFAPESLWVCVMRDLPIVETVAYRPVGVFEIGQIPPAGVPHGTTLAFYVYSELLGSQATLGMTAQPQPEGEMTFDPLTGLIVYRPGANDVLPFDVLFTATLGDQTDEQAVAVSPIAALPEEYSFVSAPVQAFPDDQSRDYLFVNEIVSDQVQMHNGENRTVRSVTIAGKTVVFADGHANGLYGAYNSPDGGPYIADLAEMTVYAETVVIGSRLHLPQTNVTVYARRLVFAGADAQVVTTPCADGDGGDIALYIDVYESDDPVARFVVSGSGQAGRSGQMTHSLNRFNPLAWLSPYSVKMALAYARDAYICGYSAEAVELLSDYRELLSTLMSLDTWDSLDSQWQFEFEQMYGEIVTLLHRLENGLDYFGNPAGWVPMLSFEITKAFYDQEINRTVRILYLSYWLQYQAVQIEDKANGLANSRNALWLQAQDLKNQYATIRAMIPSLKNEAERISAQIGQADSEACFGLLCTLKQKEAELIARADKLVEKRHKIPLWKRYLRALGFSATSTIEGAASGGKAGLVGGVLKSGINLYLKELPAHFEPWPEISSRTDVTKAFNSIDFAAESGAWLDNFDDIDTQQIFEGDPSSYLESLRSQAAGMAGGMHQVKESLRETSLSNEEVQIELERIKAEDPIFNALVDKVTQLAVEKEVFNRQLSVAMQKVSELSNAITNNLLSIDALNRDASHLNRVIDPRAMMYIKDMERRALERLRKYHYYLAKSYEYRMLEPSPLNLNIQRMFDAMQAIGSSNGTLGTDDFNALKTVYEEELWALTDKIYQDYQNHGNDDFGSGETSTIVVTELLPEQIADLNAGKTVTLNLKSTLGFQYNEENIRITNIEVQEMNLAAAYSPSEYFDFRIEHAGVSRLQKKGQIYRFIHYTDIGRELNPLHWSRRYFGDGVSVPHSPSDASISLLYSLLSSERTSTDVSNIMLYARPGAWADIMLKKIPRDGTTVQMMIETVRLRVYYDYNLRHPSRRTLQVATEPKGIHPYFQVNQEDVLNRKDGLGEFYRTYASGQSATVTAPLRWGHYEFVKWTDGAGITLTTNPEVGVMLDSNRKRIAQYIYTGPLPKVADFNDDYWVDYYDFEAMARVWMTTPAHPDWDARFDISDSGDVGLEDLMIFLEDWLATD